MRVRPAFLVIALAVSACSTSDGATEPKTVVTTAVTLGPAMATDAYRPSGLPATWSGFCPVATPSTVTLTAGNAYQVVNQSGQAVSLITLPNRAVIETIAAGAVGTKHIEYGAVSQATFTFTVTASGCTDTQSGQGLFNVTVNSK
ncbi:MAG: hypothetical protein H3C62_12135 [Gemmatimonadaceae bacterium]|nr:hypothetical protein [Gemmatimonadaceae bacterium]